MSHDASSRDGTNAPVYRTLSAPWAAVATFILGLAIVYVVGFAGAETIHNAAHDARHSLNFPCH
jgi:cobalt transporter subunit CbtB